MNQQQQFIEEIKDVLDYVYFNNSLDLESERKLEKLRSELQRIINTYEKDEIFY